MMMIFLQTIWDVLFDAKSLTLDGTLFNLKSVVGRDGVKAECAQNWNENDRFLHTVLACFIVTRFLDFVKLPSASSAVPAARFSGRSEWLLLNKVEQRRKFDAIMREFVDSFFTVDSTFLRDPAPPTVAASAVDTFYACGGVTPDGRKCKRVYKLQRGEPLRKHRLICDLGGKDVKADACFPVNQKTKAVILPDVCMDISAAQRNEQAILNFSLCYFAMRDAVREGDGDRVHVYWKVFFVMCERTHHTNYVVECIDQYAQLFALLPKSMALEQKYNRFVNQRGGLGKCIPMDLMLKFWNKLAKVLLAAVGYRNLTPQKIIDIGASISTIHSINNY
jgi:hypothetical protein